MRGADNGIGCGPSAVTPRGSVSWTGAAFIVLVDGLNISAPAYRQISVRHNLAGLPHQSFSGELDTDTAYLAELIERDRGRTTILDCLDECGRTCLMSLVLTPEVHSAEARPTVSAQPPEVIKLENSARTEDLQPLLGETSASVGEVVHGAD